VELPTILTISCGRGQDEVRRGVEGGEADTYLRMRSDEEQIIVGWRWSSREQTKQVGLSEDREDRAHTRVASRNARMQPKCPRMETPYRVTGVVTHPRC
jgi:hypothetical protein